jgi:hypothetical protein
MKTVLRSAAIIIGSIWLFYLLYGWYAYSLIPNFLNFLKEEAFNHLIFQTIVAFSLLFGGIFIGKPGSENKEPINKPIVFSTPNQLNKPEIKDELRFAGERSISNDAYKLFLSRKYNIEKNEIFNQYSCQERLFDTVDEAVAYAASLEKINSYNSYPPRGENVNSTNANDSYNSFKSKKWDIYAVCLVGIVGILSIFVVYLDHYNDAKISGSWGKGVPKSGVSNNINLSSKSYAYEPQVVELRGLLVSPKGESPDGSEVRFYAVELSDTINVIGDGSDSINSESVNGVKIVQLAGDKFETDQIKSNLGKTARLSGTLFHSHTVHHFTDVLMSVDSIKLN